MRLYPLRILGVALVGGPEIEERRTSADDGANQAFFDDRGDRTLSVRGNAYVQTRAHAATMAQYLLDRCEYPAADGARQRRAWPAVHAAGDRVTVADAPTMSATFTGYVTAVAWNFDGDGFRQNVEALQASQLFPERRRVFRVGDAHVLQQSVRVLLMALIDIFPPTFASGELLSAAKLNQLSDVANGIKGVALAPTSIFCRSGNDSIWYARRRGRYVSVDFTTSGTSFALPGF